MKLFNGLSIREIRSTTAFRLAALLGVLFFLGVSALGTLIYGLTTAELTARSEEILQREAAQLLQVSPDQLSARVELEMERNARGLDRFSLLSPDGKLLIGSIPPFPGLAVGAAVDIEARASLGPMRVLAVRAKDQNIILLGRDISEIRYLERHILIAIVVSCLAIIPCVLLIGGLLSVPSLLRVQELQRIAKRVSGGEFTLRLPDSGREDELDRMALTVNLMIEDIGRIVDQVKNVTDAVAHDLRTPLTRVRSQLEAMRSEEPEGHRMLVDAVIDDLDLVLDRFSALLRISEIEVRKQKSGFQILSLNALVNDVIDLYQPVAEEAAVSLNAKQTDEIAVFADRSLLFEALTNLVDNAIKYARREISVILRKESGTAILIVRDDGPGIAEAERDAVVRRFYRDPNNSERHGSGLGLSVVSAILHLHRFKLELSDAAPGLMAKIVMPDS